jgi:hypothetical protein
VIATSGKADVNSSDLIQRFHEDCNLRDMISTMDYIYRAKEYCAFLESRGKNPLTADRDDLRAFFEPTKGMGIEIQNHL